MKVYDLISAMTLGYVRVVFYFRGYRWLWDSKMCDYFTTINGEIEWFSERYNIFSILDQDITTKLT